MQTRTPRIAGVFQEILTVIVRIRAGRHQVPDPQQFRQQMRGALQTAEQEVVRLGCNSVEARLAAQGVVAFLDESVLTTPNQLLHTWMSQPIGPEYFRQGHVAGEIFFNPNIQGLLAGENSPRVADLLEVYQLCLLLGYRGQFGSSREGDIRTIIGRIAEKRQRILGATAILRPDWRPANESVPAPPDAWGRRLLWLAAGSAGLFVLSFLLYWFLLRGDVASLTQTAAALVAGGFRP